MYYVLHAMEKIYHGEYGIDNWILIEQPSVDAAKRNAAEASKNLMNKYIFISVPLRKEANRRAAEENIEINSPKYYEILDEIYGANVAYEIYKVNDNELDESLLYRNFHYNREEFLKEFCSLII